MTDTPNTVDELLDQWAGTHAPEEAKLRHPSSMLWTPRVLRVVGKAWSLHELSPGWWAAFHDDRQVTAASHMTDSDAFRAVCEMNDDVPPRAESLGCGGDVEQAFRRPVPSPSLLRGIAWAAVLSAPLWFAGVYAVGRLVGWW